MAVLTTAERARAARREVWRAAALQAATERFAHQGFHGTGMGDVAADAGVSLRALYTVFPGKDELFDAVLQDAYARLLPVLDGQTSVSGLIADLFEFLGENRSVCLLYVRGDHREPFAAYTNAGTEGIAAVVRRAGSTVRPALVAQSLVATIIAVIVDALAADPQADLRALAPDVVAIYRPLF